MLGPTREIHDLNLNYAKNRAGEAGGIVSFVEYSGVMICGYVANPVGASPVGIQLNDVEFMNLSRHYHPATQRGMRRVDRPGAVVGLSRDCVVDTNFIHPNAIVYSGQKAYLGPSGLLTHDASLGGELIGHFLSDIGGPGLPRNNQPITIYGGGYSRDQVFVKTHEGWYITTEGDTPVQITTPGFARVRIKI